MSHDDDASSAESTNPAMANMAGTPMRPFVADIGGVQLTVGRYRLDPSMRALMIGPLVLTIPLTDDNVTEVIKALMGVEVVRGIAPMRLDKKNGV